jgi:hypothetical protein
MGSGDPVPFIPFCLFGGWVDASHGLGEEDARGKRILRGGNVTEILKGMEIEILIRRLNSTR